MNDGASRRDGPGGRSGWNAGWDAGLDERYIERYEAEIARYYRLSRVLHDAMVGSGDPAMARARRRRRCTRRSPRCTRITDSFGEFHEFTSSNQESAF